MQSRPSARPAVLGETVFGSTSRSGTARPRDLHIAADLESWFALWTRSRHEQTVCAQLTGKDIQSFLPTVTRMSRWKDRTKRIAWPLFPGYCFARFRPSRVLAIATCTGVVTIVSTGNVPVPVPDAEIEALQRLIQSGLIYDPCPLLEPGTMVRVVEGPLCGVVGRLIRKGSQDQLIIGVDILNSGARVQVSAEDIRPL
jgi:transcriptional antiterminator NusG